ncbi:MAG: hypothetical protein ABSH06_11680 [Thermodesulfobacteriota bacterium]|jgi:hypothetical protein
MKSEIIVVALSSEGIEKVKLFHDGKTDSVNSILTLYKRINPYLNRLNKAASEGNSAIGFARKPSKGRVRKSIKPGPRTIDRKQKQGG